MAFMVPQVVEASKAAPVTCWEDSHGESWFNPDGVTDTAYYAEKAWLTETYESGFFARLSAPGYLDCTEWVGPFVTEAEALAAVTDDDDES